MKEFEDGRSKKFLGMRDTVNVITIIAYVIFSMVKRVWENQDLYWIPLLLVCVNLVIIFGSAIAFVKINPLRRSSKSVWLISQLLINVALGILIYNYLEGN